MPLSSAHVSLHAGTAQVTCMFAHGVKCPIKQLPMTSCLGRRACNSPPYQRLGQTLSSEIISARCTRQLDFVCTTHFQFHVTSRLVRTLETRLPCLLPLSSSSESLPLLAFCRLHGCWGGPRQSVWLVESKAAWQPQNSPDYLFCSSQRPFTATNGILAGRWTHRQSS